MNALSVKDLQVKINESHILHGVTFEVPTNKVTALLGRNGVGKSTTLRTIMGFYEGTGSVELNGKEILGMQTHKIVQAGVAFVPEDREVFASLTVKENLSLAARGKNNEEAYKAVYDLFPELDTRAAQQAGSLSGGQQQRVAIARSLSRSSDLILLDEPLANLDFKLREQLRDELQRIFSDANMMVIYSTAEPLEALDMASHTIVMNQGRVQQDGPALDMYSKPKNHFLLKIIVAASSW